MTSPLTEHPTPKARAASPDVRADRARYRSWWLAGSVAILFLALPLAVLVGFGGSPSTLRHLGNPTILMALRLSLLTSALATVLCVAGGLPLAYALARGRFRGLTWVDTLIDLPMTLPPVVAGVALLLTFGPNGPVGRGLDALGLRVVFTTAALVMAQTFMAAPFFIRAAKAGFEAVPISLEQAAMTLGRSPWGVFWSVSVPLAGPALLAGAVLAWARALSEFGASMMFAGNLPGVTQTLPLAVMSAMEVSLELAVAISVLSLVLAVAALIGTRLLARWWNTP